MIFHILQIHFYSGELNSKTHMFSFEYTVRTTHSRLKINFGLVEALMHCFLIVAKMEY